MTARAGESQGSTEDRLAHLVENVPDARSAFGVRDSAGNTMDTAKIIEDPAGGYLAVYHSQREGVFTVSVATSDDLLRWTHRGDLASHASQPYLTAVRDGGFVVVWEADTTGYDWLSFRFYPSRDRLFAGDPERVFDAPHTLVPARRWAEGTPNVRAARLAPDIDHSVIDVGFHYWWNGDVDRQARGRLTGFCDWTTMRERRIDDAVLTYGVRGNIGDRDSLVLGGESFTLVEGQYTKGDFGSWRVFLYSPRSGTARALAIRTPGGSSAFANPAATVLRGPDGVPTLAVSLFLPSEGAAPGEAGQLVYYSPLAAARSR
jgi:hypothetical protein